MKLFVWDFHGVLEKGNELATLEISNSILKQFGYRQQFTKSTLSKLYGLKWYRYFEYLLPDEPSERHFELQAACFERSSSHPEIIAKWAQPNDHALEVIRKISKSHDQIVISNTKPKSLEMYLKNFHLDRFFLPDKAFAADAHGKDAITKKHHLLTDYLKDKHYENFVYIGDSPEDLELASIFGGKTYLYAHPGQPHKKIPAFRKIHDLREILAEV